MKMIPKYAHSLAMSWLIVSLLTCNKAVADDHTTEITFGFHTRLADHPEGSLKAAIANTLNYENPTFDVGRNGDQTQITLQDTNEVKVNATSHTAEWTFEHLAYEISIMDSFTTRSPVTVELFDNQGSLIRTISGSESYCAINSSGQINGPLVRKVKASATPVPPGNSLNAGAYLRIAAKNLSVTLNPVNNESSPLLLSAIVTNAQEEYSSSKWQVFIVPELANLKVKVEAVSNNIEVDEDLELTHGDTFMVAAAGHSNDGLYRLRAVASTDAQELAQNLGLIFRFALKTRKANGGSGDVEETTGGGQANANNPSVSSTALSPVDGEVGAYVKIPYEVYVDTIPSGLFTGTVTVRPEIYISNDYVVEVTRRELGFDGASVGLSFKFIDYSTSVGGSAVAAVRSRMSFDGGPSDLSGQVDIDSRALPLFIPWDKSLSGQLVQTITLAERDFVIAGAFSTFIPAQLEIASSARTSNTNLFSKGLTVGPLRSREKPGSKYEIK